MIQNKESIAEAETEVMVEPLCNCLCDKKAEIRKMAEEIIVEVMRQTGPEPFFRQLTSLKPAVQQTVKPILDKAKAKTASGGVQAAPAQQEAKPAAPVKKK